LNGDYDGYSGGVNTAGSNNSSRRAMAPILELDFESRIMFNAKIPKKRPLADHLRKNDFLVDSFVEKIDFG
jgi:hypothetical protein